MASEVSHRHSATGETLYFTIRNTTRQMWNTGGTPNFETLTVANWTSYKIAMSESPASSYFYAGTFPAISGNMVAGWYWCDVFKQAGGSAAIGDTLYASYHGYWDGTTYKFWGDDTIQIGGTAQTAVDLGAINVTNLNTLSSHDPGATLGTSTLTQPQVTGGAYALNSSSFAFNAALDLTTTQKASVTDAAGDVTGDTGITLEKALEMLAAFMAGKVSVSSSGGVSTYTYLKRDGATTSFTSLASETDGTRATTGSLS